MNRSGFDPISQFHIERDGLGRGLGRGLERGRDARSLYWTYKINNYQITGMEIEMNANNTINVEIDHRSNKNKGKDEMKTNSFTNQAVIRNSKTSKGENEMKTGRSIYASFLLAAAIALLAGTLLGSRPAHADESSADNLASARHFTMVYEAPQAGPVAAFVLMPETEVSLTGRREDGKWLALGNGWVQRSDLQTDVDLASLPVIQMETAFIASARHQAKIYEAPQASSRVITILMPETEMSLSGRSSDGEWLAVGDGWIQADDVRTDTDLAALPILNVATVVDQVAGK
jgi:hypothetical protein